MARTSHRPAAAPAWALILALVFGLATLAAAASSARAGVERMDFGGRQLIVYMPAHLPPPGQRALVVVLHGGLGNADRIESAQAEHGLNLDRLAEANGFLVVYLNGTPVTLRLGPAFLGWNAGGGCCGQSAATNVDDVGYITRAVAFLGARYGVDREKVYALGHSNGAMMAQRVICEADVFAAAVAVSGPLDADVKTCPTARGRRILAIHGADDQNVPIAGGVGAKGLARVAYRSEAASRQTMLDSGAAYTVEVVAGADHSMDDIDAALTRNGQGAVAQQAVALFGLAHPAP